VLASSCTPPFTPALLHAGRPALDGGIADNVPAAAVEADDGPTLVLLTRRFARLPAHPGRIYVQPSAPIPVSAWDYTDPEAIQAAFDLGCRDGASYVESSQLIRPPARSAKRIAELVGPTKKKGDSRNHGL
jgi:predicted acylesterase/phospholipase RssA